MKNSLTIFTLLLSTIGFSQNIRPSLVDSILTNQIEYSKDLIAVYENFTYNNSVNIESSKIDIGCNNESDILVHIDDSLHFYNIESNETSYITEVVDGISGSFGYLQGDEPKIVSPANWDSIYYFSENEWAFSGYVGNGQMDLIHSGSGHNATYLMGSNLHYFDGTANPVLIKSDIRYAVADLTVDERDNAWVLTRTTWPISDTLRVIDSNGNSVCDIPFLEPVNTVNGYGMMILDGKIVVGFGSSNPTYPNSLVPLEIEPNGEYVYFGEPIFESNEFDIDLASCSKSIAMPNCGTINTANRTESSFELDICPNPFSRTLIIKVKEEKIKSFSIYNAFGVSYNDTDLSYPQSKISVDVSDFPKGIYFVICEISEKEIYFRKIVKQ